MGDVCWISLDDWAPTPPILRVSFLCVLIAPILRVADRIARTHAHLCSIRKRWRICACVCCAYARNRWRHSRCSAYLRLYISITRVCLSAHRHTSSLYAHTNTHTHTPDRGLRRVYKSKSHHTSAARITHLMLRCCWRIVCVCVSARLRACACVSVCMCARALVESVAQKTLNLYKHSHAPANRRKGNAFRLERCACAHR